ncbi:hypothetical protein ABB08_22705, partial [Paenibacillus larvae]|nr:hypothetical protein [Paenibacillus larvae]MBH0344717.1 hypothetical protein [Paenibacillus larvae]
AISLDVAMFPTWNDSKSVLLLNQFQNIVHVVTSIGNHSFTSEIHSLKHFIALDTVVAIASSQFKS